MVVCYSIELVPLCKLILTIISLSAYKASRLLQLLVPDLAGKYIIQRARLGAQALALLDDVRGHPFASAVSIRHLEQRMLMQDPCFLGLSATL